MDSPCALPFVVIHRSWQCPRLRISLLRSNTACRRPFREVTILALSRGDCAYTVQSYAGKAHDNGTRFIERLPTLTADHITTHSGLGRGDRHQLSWLVKNRDRGTQDSFCGHLYSMAQSPQLTCWKPESRCRSPNNQNAGLRSVGRQSCHVVCTQKERRVGIEGVRAH